MRYLLLPLLLAVSCLGQSGLRSPAFVANLKPAAASGAWTPANISGIVQFNYGDAATGAPGAAISTWEATVGNNFTGATGATRPTLETNLVAGKAIKVIRFDGTDDYLTNKFASTIPSLPFTVFLNVESRTNGVIQRPFDSETLETPRTLLYWNSTDQMQLYAGSGFQSVQDFTKGWKEIVIIFDGASSRVQTNGSAWTVVGASPGSDIWTGVTLAVAQDIGSNFTPINLESFGVIANTNLSSWHTSLTNWMHGRLY